MSDAKFPGPDATYADIQAWYRDNAPPPEPDHEAPAVENGPSLMCNACGVVRVSSFTPFCRKCLLIIGPATGEKPNG